MKRLVLTAALAVVCAACAATSQASSSMFYRSYYSHDPVRPVKVGSRPGSVPFVNAVNGGYVRSGYRRLQSRLPDQYGSGDTYIFFETWGQAGAGL
ncbi:MAG: hypothetical protein KDA63_19845 [Planctomycetales bacterium]|nr:hypothetical protein [Planctomycetales bacterium]